MLSTIGIEHLYNKDVLSSEWRIKEDVEDFVVREVSGGRVCDLSPIVDLEKFHRANQIMMDLPVALSKEERKNIYEIANHHPFKRLMTVDGQFVVEERCEDVFVFTVMKYNYSSQSMISILSRRLSIPEAAVQIAGTKDKRGITFQEVSARCSFVVLFGYALALDKSDNIPLEKSRFAETNAAVEMEMSKHMQILDIDNIYETIRISNIRRGACKKMGDLDGNAFTIRIRGPEQNIKTPSMFINYFGPQRFGVNMNNHLVGEHILEGRYDQALELILEDCADGCGNQTQRLIWKMKKRGDSSKHIVDHLPRTTRMLYMHAFQSYKFNKEINKHIESGTVAEDDRIEENGVLMPATDTSRLEDIYLPLEKMNDKLLKGGYRKAIETFYDFKCRSCTDGVVVSFFLKKSCYATVALREITGH